MNSTSVNIVDAISLIFKCFFRNCSRRLFIFTMYIDDYSFDTRALVMISLRLSSVRSVISYIFLW